MKNIRGNSLDIIPFFRYLGAIICFGLCFYFLGIMVTGLLDMIPMTTTYVSSAYPNALMSMWAALPAVVLFFGGIRLVMVQQKRGG